MTKTYEFEWTAGQRFGFVTVEAKNMQDAKKAAKAELPLSCTSRGFATLTLIAAF